MVIFASCRPYSTIVRQVAPSGYLQNTFFMPWREIAMCVLPHFVALCPVLLYTTHTTYTLDTPRILHIHYILNIHNISHIHHIHTYTHTHTRYTTYIERTPRISNIYQVQLTYTTYILDVLCKRFMLPLGELCPNVLRCRFNKI